MSDFFQRVPESKAQIYFAEDMIQHIAESVQDQIVASETKNLPEGQGFFILEEMRTAKMQFNITVHAMWTYNVEQKKFEKFKVVTYYIYSGDMPDELLDDINKLQADNQDTIEWKQ